MYRSMKTRHSHATALVILALTAGVATPAAAETGQWSQGERARVRLLSGGVDTDGQLQGALEIELVPGWHTYWRSPGAAGIPPRADFSASTNMRDVSVSYPVPHRYDDGYEISNVYEGRVVFPLTIAPGDDAKPVALHLSLDIGVCEEVCIPEHFDTALKIAPGVTDASAAKLIADAWTHVPGPAEPGVLAVESLTRHGGTDKRPEYDVALTVPSGQPVEVYVEGPPDWYAAVPEPVPGADGAVYRVTFNRLGAKTPIDGARFTVTIVTGDRAVEQTVGLD